MITARFSVSPCNLCEVAVKKKSTRCNAHRGLRHPSAWRRVIRRASLRRRDCFNDEDNAFSQRLFGNTSARYSSSLSSKRAALGSDRSVGVNVVAPRTPAFVRVRIPGTPCARLKPPLDTFEDRSHGRAFSCKYRNHSRLPCRAASSHAPAFHRRPFSRKYRRHSRRYPDFPVGAPNHENVPRRCIVLTKAFQTVKMTATSGASAGEREIATVRCVRAHPRPRLIIGVVVEH